MEKVALVCAGGGVTGAVYEIGCLRALEEILGRSMLDLDLYVGISGGAFVAALTAAGLSPRELYEQATAGGPRLPGLSAASLYRFHSTPLALLQAAARAPRVFREAFAKALGGDGLGLSELLWTAFELLPPGLFDSSGIQSSLHALLETRLRQDRFDDLHRRLLVVAVDLDSGETVTFGKPGRRAVPVSRAVEASAALPGLYRPVRIGGREYVDGGVRKTAHVRLAIESGADLVICLNPMVPYRNDALRGPLRGHLSGRGLTWVLDQALRIMLHGRMQVGLERHRREHPQVDILLIEPTRDDLRMFGYHIMRYDARRILAEHAYRATLGYFRRTQARCRRLLARHGIAMADLQAVPALPPPPRHRSRLARVLDASLERLACRLEPRRPTRTRRSGGGRDGRRSSAGWPSGPAPKGD